jgi:hypothetical protein
MTVIVGASKRFHWMARPSPISRTPRVLGYHSDACTSLSAEKLAENMRHKATFLRRYVETEARHVRVSILGQSLL